MVFSSLEYVDCFIWSAHTLEDACIAYMGVWANAPKSVRVYVNRIRSIVQQNCSDIMSRAAHYLAAFQQLLLLCSWRGRPAVIHNRSIISTRRFNFCNSYWLVDQAWNVSSCVNLHDICVTVSCNVLFYTYQLDCPYCSQMIWNQG